MIFDSIDNLHKYQDLNPRFPLVVHFLKEHRLEDLPLGKIEIDGQDLFVNIVDSPRKNRLEARIETHNRMIDIQMPISTPEIHGFTPRNLLDEVTYDSVNDISFYDGPAQSYFQVRPGQFVIYFPWDGHAPAIADVTFRKAIFKIKNI